jgi:hypothetical protein
MSKQMALFSLALARSGLLTANLRTAYMTHFHTSVTRTEKFHPITLRRYTKMTESIKAYIITQYGLSCFEATGPGSYEARTFNFYLFPQPHRGYNRRFLCDASSLVFLASHGMMAGESVMVESSAV